MKIENILLKLLKIKDKIDYNHPYNGYYYIMTKMYITGLYMRNKIFNKIL